MKKRLIALTFNICLLFNSSVSAEVNCTYHSNLDGDGINADQCGKIEVGGLLRFNEAYLSKIRWSDFGMTCIHIQRTEDHKSGWFFLTQKGLGRSTPFTQDNGCLPFSYGLAVGISQGKVAYFNSLMEIVHHTDYVYSDRIIDGYAKVCSEMPDRKPDENGETYALIGGKCGYIDLKIDVVVDINYPYESTPAPD